MDDFLIELFTLRSGIKEPCDYLTELIKDISLLYREESEYNDIFNQFYREPLFKSYAIINCPYSLIETGELDVCIDTLRRLVSKVLTASNTPFHGEPAIDMQVIGVLEARSLDFRNIILLSLNEGQLPRPGGDPSFIPYNLRKVFGMTTTEHKSAVYAYYSYRLIQRAENIILLYNTSSNELNRGEEPHFMLRLLVEGPHKTTREYLEAGQPPQSTTDISIEKIPKVFERLRCSYGCSNPQSYIPSPPAPNAYLDCQLRLYYRYVARLKASDEVSAGINSALFGIIFHLSVQLVYTDLTANRKTIQKEELERLLRNEVRLRNYVDLASKQELFKVPADEKPEHDGVQLINSKVTISYLK